MISGEGVDGAGGCLEGCLTDEESCEADERPKDQGTRVAHSEVHDLTLKSG